MNEIQSGISEQFKMETSFYSLNREECLYE